jgi:hypothetical protein
MWDRVGVIEGRDLGKAVRKVRNSDVEDEAVLAREDWRKCEPGSRSKI